MSYQKLLDKYSTLEKEIYDSIVNHMVKHDVKSITLTDDEQFNIGDSEDTVTKIELMQYNGAMIINVFGTDNQGNDDNFYSLVDDTLNLLDKLQIISVLEMRYP